MDAGTELSEVVGSIAPPDEDAMRRSADHWNRVAKPIGSFGGLERAVTRIAGLTGDEDVRVDRRCALVMCADNGVVAQGVSQTGPEVTAVIAGQIAQGVSSVNRVSAPAKVDCFSVDVGMARPSDVPGVIDRNVARGTGDISLGPAMRREQAVEAMQVGIELVGEFKGRGYQIIASGEMGIGNTTTSSAMCAAFFGLPASLVAGRGAGLSDAGLERKVAAIERALQANAPDPGDALDVLSKLGGFDIAALAGLFIGGAVHRVPVIVDGFISALSAYTAMRLAPGCTCAMLASHVSAEPAAARLLAELGLEPVIHAGLRLGEGTGAVCLLPLLDMALSLYRGTTFEAAGIEAYEVDPR